MDDELEALFEAHRKAPPVPSASQAPVPEGALASLGDFLALQAEALAAELGKVVAFRAELPGLALASDRLSDLRTQLGHLLRNALDHGLETPEGRRAAGKAEQGVLRLEGTVEDDILTLTLADDGAGLALEALKARAREAGLLESNSALSPSIFFACREQAFGRRPRTFPGGALASPPCGARWKGGAERCP